MRFKYQQYCKFTYFPRDTLHQLRWKCAWVSLQDVWWKAQLYMCKRASLNESLRENFMSQKGKTTSYLRQSLKESQTDVSTSAPLFLLIPQSYRCVPPELLVLYFFCGSTGREHVTFHLNDAKCSTRSESTKMNSCYSSYQRLWHKNEANGSIFIVWTHKPWIHATVNKRGFARGRNCHNSYWTNPAVYDTEPTFGVKWNAILLRTEQIIMC